jgi:hypothetical protein
MTTGPFRTLILARALAVEPIARALCPDPSGERSFSPTGNRRQRIARRVELDQRRLQPGDETSGSDEEDGR